MPPPLEPLKGPTGVPRLQENVPLRNGQDLIPDFSHFKKTGVTRFSLRFLNLRKRRTDRILRLSWN